MGHLPTGKSFLAPCHSRGREGQGPSIDLSENGNTYPASIRSAPGGAGRFVQDRGGGPPDRRARGRYHDHHLQRQRRTDQAASPVFLPSPVRPRDPSCPAYSSSPSWVLLPSSRPRPRRRDCHPLRLADVLTNEAAADDSSFGQVVEVTGQVIGSVGPHTSPGKVGRTTSSNSPRKAGRGPGRCPCLRIRPGRIGEAEARADGRRPWP